MSTIEEINKEISTEIAKPEVERALIATTFKGLQPMVMRQAIMEGMLRGFSFKDFLKKNVYAIPFSGGYSLVTSIDYSRKIAMRSGLIGKSAPVYTYTEDKKIDTCSVTVKKLISGNIGDFTAEVAFKEYYKGGGKYPSLWDTKPKTMIAKVAEMHALRMAFPEEMAQVYVEEEMIKEIEVKDNTIDVVEYQIQLEGVGSEEELKKVWSSIPIQAKKELETLKNELKAKYA